MRSAEQDDDVMKIVTAALQKPPAEREAYLRIACKGNDELYREVADTVTWEQRMGEFLLHPMVILQDPTRGFCAGQIISERFEIVR